MLSTDALIHAVGGVSGVMALTGLRSASTVYTWKRNGKIPAAWQSIFSSAVDKPINPNVWRMNRRGAGTAAREDAGG